MGLLDIFSREGAAEPIRLPSGSFSVDRHGNILTSTLPQKFPEDLTHAIAQQVLLAFEGARQSEISVTEMVVRFSGLKITAKEMRGGALIFLAPQSAMTA